LPGSAVIAPRIGPSRDPRRLRLIGGRILLVDDEPAIRMICEVNLAAAGFTPVSAANPAPIRGIGVRDMNAARLATS